jgi:hypothetical protein
LAILSKKNRLQDGPSGGYDYDRLEHTIFGSHRSKVTRRKELYSSDYIYHHRVGNCNDDFDDDAEIGVNRYRLER